ncbi:SDR family oxidoreductase [Micromonospora sp. LA-10]|uniref:SDR family oxidoreductase n=1 Tax=Micromonospora sp. LA-10 TaxID=3446364 RepID=UPI003F6F823A
MDISGNTIFIPGATSGIGLALALALRDRGNTVIIGGRRAQLLDEIAAANPGLDTVTIDTADPASITAAADRVLAKHPDLNVLVTMAGVMRIEDWRSPDTFLASAEEVVTTNVLGPIRLIAAFVEHLRQRGNATIVTVSSGLAFVPLRVTPSYNASKAAVHMLSESIRLNLAGTGVRVLELVPPAVRTELLPGHESNETAMPLDEFVAEVMTLLESQPDATEIQVERVKFLRHAEARGDYDKVVATVNATIRTRPPLDIDRYLSIGLRRSAHPHPKECEPCVSPSCPGSSPPSRPRRWQRSAR